MRGPSSPESYVTLRCAPRPASLGVCELCIFQSVESAIIQALDCCLDVVHLVQPVWAYVSFVSFSKRVSIIQARDCCLDVLHGGIDGGCEGCHQLHADTRGVSQPDEEENEKHEQTQERHKVGHDGSAMKKHVRHDVVLGLLQNSQAQAMLVSA